MVTAPRLAAGEEAEEMIVGRAAVTLGCPGGFDPRHVHPAPRLAAGEEAEEMSEACKGCGSPDAFDIGIIMHRPGCEAGEVARLRAEVKRLRAVLSRIAIEGPEDEERDNASYWSREHIDKFATNAAKSARAALRKGKRT